MKSTVSESQLFEALKGLESILQGSEPVNKSQIVTGKGSSKGTLKEEDQSEDDKIDENGTDYKGVNKGLRKAEDDDEDEDKEDEKDEDDKDEDEDEEEEDTEKSSCSMKDKKKMMKKAEKDDDEDEDKDDEDEDEDEDEDKDDEDEDVRSPEDFKGKENLKKRAGIRRSVKDGDVKKGLEISDFLFYLNKSVSDAFDDMTHRIKNRIKAYHEQRGEFCCALAQAIDGMDKSLEKQESRVGEVEKEPERAAKSVINSDKASSLKKSLGDAVQKRAEILAEMSDMLMKGDSSISPLDIVKFEGGGPIRPEIQPLLKSLNK